MFLSVFKKFQKSKFEYNMHNLIIKIRCLFKKSALIVEISSLWGS